MISWPLLHSPTETTSRASSSLELPTNELWRLLAPEWRVHHAAVGHKAGHVARRRHIERRIQRGRSIRRYRPARDHGDLTRRALLDRDQVAVSQPCVDRGPRRG